MKYKIAMAYYDYKQSGLDIKSYLKQHSESVDILADLVDGAKTV